MSRWVDQFENHAIHETLRHARGWAETELEEIDAEHEAEKRRLIKVFDLIEKSLEGLDLELFPEPNVSSLNSHLRHQNLWNQLQSYSANKNVQHLKTANDHMNGQMSTIYLLGGLAKKPESRKAIKSLETAYDNFCSKIEKTKDAFTKIVTERTKEIEVLGANAAELDGLMSSLKSSAETHISKWQQEFTESQTKRIEEHSEAQIARSREYEEELERFKKSSEADQKETTIKHDQALQAAFDAYVADVKSKSEEISTKHREILKLHGLVTSDGVAGGYKKGADEERRAATIWSVISMLCYGTILLWVLLKGKLGFGINSVPSLPNVGIDANGDADPSEITEMLGIVASAGTDWPLVVTTLSITAVAFVAAQFAGRQSRVHRMNEQRLRWFSFEIAAIDPFISTLKQEQQQELKQQLTEKLFGQDRVVEERPVRSKGIDSDTLKSVTEPIVEAVKSIR